VLQKFYPLHPSTSSFICIENQPEELQVSGYQIEASFQKGLHYSRWSRLAGEFLLPAPILHDIRTIFARYSHNSMARFEGTRINTVKRPQPYDHISRVDIQMSHISYLSFTLRYVFLIDTDSSTHRARSSLGDRKLLGASSKFIVIKSSAPSQLTLSAATSVSQT
jgi:hypothetical protein